MGWGKGRKGREKEGGAGEEGGRRESQSSKVLGQQTKYFQNDTP